MPKHRLKIAFVIDDLGHGGAQRQLSVLAEGLAATLEPQVYCLSQVTRPFAEKIRNTGAPVFTLKRLRGVDFTRFVRLSRYFASERVDIVHGFLDAANVYAYLAARRNRLPCVLTLQSERFLVGGVKGWCLRRALRGADRVMANSSAGGRYLTDVVSVERERLAVIPNAIRLPVPGESADTADDRPSPTHPVVGFVGRLVDTKRVDLLVDAFAELTRVQPEVRLTIVGDGPEKNPLRERIRRAGIDDRVDMAGAVDDVERWMAGFTCLALPSELEGLPNVLLEALAHGVPVVASATGDVEDIVVDGKTGFRIRDTSPEALASLLNRVISDEDLQRRVRDEGPAMIGAKYSVEAAVDRLLAMYAELAGTDAISSSMNPR
jgi:glycosyltransferase involved in cell wall biosynthesis